MKLSTFKDKLKNIEHYSVQGFLDNEFMGSCPCFSAKRTIEGYTLYVWGRCWRVSEDIQDLFVSSDMPKKDLKEIGKTIKEHLDEQKWYNPYTLKYKPLSFFQNNIP